MGLEVWHLRKAALIVKSLSRLSLTNRTRINLYKKSQPWANDTSPSQVWFKNRLSKHRPETSSTDHINSLYRNRKSCQDKTAMLGVMDQHMLYKVLKSKILYKKTNKITGINKAKLNPGMSPLSQDFLKMSLSY